MKDIGAEYDPSKNPFTPLEPGNYPAHIVGYGTREVQTKAGPAIVINLTYQVAEEASKLIQMCWEMDGYDYRTDNNGERIPIANGKGKQKSIKCNHLVGRKFKDNGTFVFTNSESSGKNKRYFDLLDTLDVELQENKDGVTPLSLLEEEDVIGKPVFAKVGSETYITSETKNLPEGEQEKRTAWKVFSIHTWSEGERMSQDDLEDPLPF